MGNTESLKVARSKAKASKAPKSPPESPRPRAIMHNKKASMACTLCRSLRKKCIPGPGARCQRCARKDEVCRFVEVAYDATAPRPPRRGRSVSSEVKPLEKEATPPPESPPHSPSLTLNSALPWASELIVTDAMLQHAPHKRHPTTHPLFSNWFANPA
ncbi:hypothetical protein FIBSPDRAFT_943606 [Athelia psychrophila]|uniref:Zn(2)-C6 fungal-type domain-containing protein n=1 Tax=Athelia psychrophila TaxID=1759441 RepID=A0A166VYV1_9AGAM|nr:hypothetical protein FIBSPDRAFT_943606 [Fibularhizoctonia sp. CBS 109695]